MGKTRELFHDVNEWMMSVELRPNFKAGLYMGGLFGLSWVHNKSIIHAITVK
jgi:hypothetical protein